MADLSNITSRIYNETREPKRAIITFHKIDLWERQGQKKTHKVRKRQKSPLKKLTTVTDAPDSAVFGAVIGNSQTIGQYKVNKTAFNYRVMFNPSSIKLSASGGTLVEKRKYNTTDGVNDNTEGTADVNYDQNDRRNMTFSVNLIFDQVNPSDAFSQVNPFELSGSIKSAVNTVNNNVKNKEYSVQKEVEGFLSACRRPQTRCITFQMGDMAYTGIVFQVSAQYTMFNPNGEPIRAVVFLEMTMVDSNLGYGDMGQFSDSFREVFQTQNVSLNTAKNKISGLVNLDL